MNSIPLDRASLLDAIARGRSFSFRLFYGHTPRRDGALSDAVFSQWWGAPFEVDGARYPTAEHWMMAGKARLFGDDEALAAILDAPTPAAAKALGRQVRGFDDARWAQRRFDLVVEGNVQKFGADPALRAHLLATEDSVLVEASPRDRIWGIGLSASHPDAQHPARWRGSNLLGFALVRARERLRAERP
jgi:ribA/ribD-fused uncharacterized protein